MSRQSMNRAAALNIARADRARQSAKAANLAAIAAARAFENSAEGSAIIARQDAEAKACAAAFLELAAASGVSVADLRASAYARTA